MFLFTRPVCSVKDSSVFWTTITIYIIFRYTLNIHFHAHITKMDKWVEETELGININIHKWCMVQITLHIYSHFLPFLRYQSKPINTPVFLNALIAMLFCFHFFCFLFIIDSVIPFPVNITNHSKYFLWSLYRAYNFISSTYYYSFTTATIDGDIRY